MSTAELDKLSTYPCLQLCVTHCRKALRFVTSSFCFQPVLCICRPMRATCRII